MSQQRASILTGLLHTTAEEGMRVFAPAPARRVFAAVPAASGEGR